jgi:hypothetical protein
MLKPISILTGAIAAFALLPQAQAQITQQEFQMGIARDACVAQAQQEAFVFNNFLATSPTFDRNNQMTGSVVTFNASRNGRAYLIECRYNNASRSATINARSLGTPPGNGSALPTEGSFQGRGLVSGSVFGAERPTDAFLTFNANNFSFSLATLEGGGTTAGGAELNYNGTVVSLDSTRASGGAGNFILRGRVNTFASSANNLQVFEAPGTCQIEVADGRVIASDCSTSFRDSTTRFDGIPQF